MQNQYTTLETLASIVTDTLHPTQYAVTTREMILHSNLGWEEIYSHLLLLSQEDLVVISPGERIQFCITETGLEKMAELSKTGSVSFQQHAGYILA